MIVRPDEISANNAPSTSPLNSCETKFAQLTTNNPAPETLANDHDPTQPRRIMVSIFA